MVGVEPSMASRRRQAERTPLTSPARRSSRRRAAAPDGGSPGGRGRAEGDAPRQPPDSPREVFETPKRTLRKKSRSTKVNSPLIENDMLQEIFWDPHSPVARGNGQKKQTTNRCTVEISEIVNRIAPQDEKPDNYEGTLLGLWIGDDAIPSTPGIANIQSRKKVNGARGHRLKSKEEELMKLAKQFDKNLMDAIQDHDASCHCTHNPTDAEMSVEQQHRSEVGNQRFLEEWLQSVTAVGAVKESCRRTEDSGNHETSIDLEAEVALNALFDGPTQKCSQSLSDCSPAKSSHGSQKTLLVTELLLEKKRGASAELPRQSSSPILEIVGSVSADVASKQAVKKESVATDKPATVGDDFDDWGADVLSDDSFLMHINQNPELINIIENAVPHSNANSEAMVKSFNSDKPKSNKCAFLKFSNGVPASHSFQEESSGLGKAKPVFLHSDCHSVIGDRDSVSKITLNRIPGCSSVPVKPKGAQEGFTQLKSIPSTVFAEKSCSPILAPSNIPQPKTGIYRTIVHNSSHQLPTNPGKAEPHDLQKATVQFPQQAKAAKKYSSFNDWNELRFSDDVLNSFCDSSSLWGANCDEDDDLLYQVCDDIEKRTLSQATETENKEAKLPGVSASKSEMGPCLVVPKQGLSSFPQVPRSHTGRKTFSLDAPTLLKNKDSAGTPIQRSCTPFQNETTNSVPGKWHRSFSVPEGGSASGIGPTAISDLDQKGFCNTGKIKNNGSSNQMLTENSKYVFRKTSTSQALALNDKCANIGSLPVTHLGLGERKNSANVPLNATLQMNAKPVFKRHLSDCFVHSETEQKSRKCSQEEIAKKKQEALQRRKCKLQGLQKNPSPT